MQACKPPAPTRELSLTQARVSRKDTFFAMKWDVLPSLGTRTPLVLSLSRLSFTQTCTCGHTHTHACTHTHARMHASTHSASNASRVCQQKLGSGHVTQHVTSEPIGLDRTVLKHLPLQLAGFFVVGQAGEGQPG